MNTLDFNQFVSFIPNLTDDQVDILRVKTLTDGTPMFSNISLIEAYDIVEMVNRLSNATDLVQYIEDNQFDSPEDIILEFPQVFKEERNNYEIRRREEEMTTAVTESIYQCNVCQRPVVSRTKQTRGGDEGAAVFLVCERCNITRTI